MTIRCEWVTQDPLYLSYHDNEWGVVTKDGHKLFEMLCLEGQQTGLSWITILKKRENYRQRFHQFNPHKIALMTTKDIDNLMNDTGLIRHRAKLDAIVHNAQIYLAMEKHGEYFSDFIWSFVSNTSQITNASKINEIPASTPVSLALSKALKKKGFKFVGPTTCYSFMQACGMVNDHVTECFCHPKHLNL